MAAAAEVGEVVGLAIAAGVVDDEEEDEDEYE